MKIDKVNVARENIYNNREHHIYGVQMLGLVGRILQRRILFIQVVKKKDHDTLVTIIRKYVHVLVLLFHTSSWQGYNGVGNYRHIHHIINHSLEHIDSELDAIQIQLKVLGQP